MLDMGNFRKACRTLDALPSMPTEDGITNMLTGLYPHMPIARNSASVALVR
jgi:hypothetical protein